MIEENQGLSGRSPSGPGSQASPGAAEASPPTVSIPNAARELFRGHCDVGSRATLQRYGEGAAVAAISAVLDRDRLIDLLSAELGDSYDCTRVWPAWGYGTMDEDDFKPVNNRVEEMADGIIAVLLAQAIEARSAATAKTGAVEDESAVPQGCAHPGAGQ